MNIRKNDVLLLLISSVILVIAWVIFSLIHLSLTSTINEVLSQQISAINPSFDTKTINALKNRENITPVYSFSNTNTASGSAGTVVPSSTPTPTVVTPTPIPSSATLPFASQSAKLATGGALVQ